MVFKDNLRIGPGEVWDREILGSLKRAKVVLAVIGKQWFLHDENSRPRFYNQEDWVRREIEYALQKGKIVIPLFLDNVKLM